METTYKEQDKNKDSVTPLGAKGWKDILQLLKEQGKKIEMLGRAFKVIQEGMLKNNLVPVKLSVVVELSVVFDVRFRCLEKGKGRTLVQIQQQKSRYDPSVWKKEGGRSLVQIRRRKSRYDSGFWKEEGGERWFRSADESRATIQVSGKGGKWKSEGGYLPGIFAGERKKIQGSTLIGKLYSRF